MQSFSFIRSKLHHPIVRNVNKSITKVYLSTRPSAKGISLDTHLIAKDFDLVVSHLKARRANDQVMQEVNKIQHLREQRNLFIHEGDKARSQRKTLSKDIGLLMKKGELQEAEKLKKEVEDCVLIAENFDQKLLKVDQEIESIMSCVPNLLDDRVPDGDDDNHNVIVSEWGSDKRKIGSTYKWHDDIAKELGGLDQEAAARVSGTRFSVLVGPVAKLERALIQYFLDFHTSRGYTEVSVPYIVSRSTMQGTGQLPKFEEDLFKVSHQVSGEDAFLIPTAEVPVTNLFRQQLLSEVQLPIRLVCHSPSFRAEAGSGGRDTRGLLRQHQFQKVELVKICSPETSQEEHERLTKDAESLLESLELPYRRMLLCSGDIGFAARICYDLEVWLPGQQTYREISSCSNCYDFQSKRMMLRYRTNDTKKQIIYPHTINGSGVAVGRALVAILENYQEADGSVIVPQVLRSYMGGIDKLVPSKKDFLYQA